MASYEFYPLTGERALLTPNVTLLREGNLTGYRALPEEPQLRVHALSAAAFHFNNEGQAMRTPGLFQSLVRLWGSVIEAAKTSTCSRLIVSAVGCGAFSNPPEEVARAFLIAIERATPGRYLTHIYVCVMDDHNARDNGSRVRQVLIADGAQEQPMP